MEREELKKKIKALSDEEKDFLRVELNIKKDEDKDLIDSVLELTKRVEELEKLMKKPERKKGFLSGLFED